MGRGRRGLPKWFVEALTSVPCTVMHIVSMEAGVLAKITCRSQRSLGVLALADSRAIFTPVLSTGVVATTTSVPTARSSGACIKCGTTKKSGKRSCCARGGAWFKKCGDADDTKFDHTWTEGIETCKGFAAWVSFKSPLQLMLRRVRVFVDPLNATNLQNVTNQHAIIYRGDIVSNDSSVGSENCVGLAKVVVCICYVLLNFTS